MQALLQHPMQHGACVDAVQSRDVKSTCRGGAAACDLWEAASALLSASARGCRAAGVLCCCVPFVSAAPVPARSAEGSLPTLGVLQYSSESPPGSTAHACVYGAHRQAAGSTAHPTPSITQGMHVRGRTGQLWRLSSCDQLLEGLGARLPKHLALVPDGHQAVHLLLHLRLVIPAQLCAQTQHSSLATSCRQAWKMLHAISTSNRGLHAQAPPCSCTCAP